MNFHGVDKKALWGIAAGILLLGCSPSSYTERYGLTQQKGTVATQTENSYPLDKKEHSGKKILSKNRFNQKAKPEETKVLVTSIRRFSSENEPSYGRNSKETEVSNLSRSGSADSEKYLDTVRVSLPDYLREEDEDEDLPEEKSIDISHLVSKYSSTDPDVVNDREKFIMEIIKYLNTPYRFGGNTEKGIDCSAFTKNVFNHTFSFGLPRSAREQFQIGEEVQEKNDLKIGDLVFFNTRRGVRPGHVGIYLGDNLFAHASSHQGVTVSSLDSTYYSKRYMGGRRIDKALIK